MPGPAPKLGKPATDPTDATKPDPTPSTAQTIDLDSKPVNISPKSIVIAMPMFLPTNSGDAVRLHHNHSHNACAAGVRSIADIAGDEWSGYLTNLTSADDKTKRRAKEVISDRIVQAMNEYIGRLNDDTASQTVEMDTLSDAALSFPPPLNDRFVTIKSSDLRVRFHDYYPRNHPKSDSKGPASKLLISQSARARNTRNPELLSTRGENGQWMLSIRPQVTTVSNVTVYLAPKPSRDLVAYLDEQLDTCGAENKYIVQNKREFVETGQVMFSLRKEIHRIAKEWLKSRQKSGRILMKDDITDSSPEQGYAISARSLALPDLTLNDSRIQAVPTAADDHGAPETEASAVPTEPEVNPPSWDDTGLAAQRRLPTNDSWTQADPGFANSSGPFCTTAPRSVAFVEDSNLRTGSSLVRPRDSDAISRSSAGPASEDTQTEPHNGWGDMTDWLVCERPPRRRTESQGVVDGTARGPVATHSSTKRPSDHLDRSSPPLTKRPYDLGSSQPVTAQPVTAQPETVDPCLLIDWLGNQGYPL